MISVDVTTSGPFFSGAIKPKVERALDDTLQELVEKGEARLGELLQKGGVYKEGSESTGYYRSMIHGEVKAEHSGLITDGGVIYGPWLEGTGSRNQSTRFKGYASFRKVEDWLVGQAQDVAIKHFSKLVGELD